MLKALISPDALQLSQDHAALLLPKLPIPATSARLGSQAVSSDAKSSCLRTSAQTTQTRRSFAPRARLPQRKVARLQRHRPKPFSSLLQAPQRRARESLHFLRILSRYNPASASPMLREGNWRPSISATGITPSLLFVMKHSSASPIFWSEGGPPNRGHFVTHSG